jgi:hypothetical protein
VLLSRGSGSEVQVATIVGSGCRTRAARHRVGADRLRRFRAFVQSEDVSAEAIIEKGLPDLEPEWRSTVERLIEVILVELPDAQHERKWGRLTFTREGNWHHWICAISPTKGAVRLVIHKGALLADPRRAMEGAGRYTRTISFRTPEETDPDVVAPILREAAARQTEMRPSHPS